jgi:hypothetical protein
MVAFKCTESNTFSFLASSIALATKLLTLLSSSLNYRLSDLSGVLALKQWYYHLFPRILLHQ